MSKNPAILVLNAGSSSVKFSLFRLVDDADLRLACKGQLDGIGVDPAFEAHSPDGQCLIEEHWAKGDTIVKHLAGLLGWIETHLDDAEIIAAGHRIVHGGRRFSAPTLINDDVLAELDRLIPLAPLHEPFHLAAIRAITQLHPDLPQIACFDTAFHHDNDSLAKMIALPRSLIEEGLQRYGFHGLSYEFIARRLHSLDSDLAEGRVVVCHLGNGASMCAIEKGRSVASTMGFTALDGLPMGTRTGQIDPGVLLYLMREKQMGVDALESLLYKQSGLLGLSGVSSDMRVLMKSDDPHAKEAIDFFTYRIGRELGSLAAAMGGIDGLVFTAGIGEHAPAVRAAVVKQAGWLGFQLDEMVNGTAKETRISPQCAKPVWVIPTDEELMIARHSASLLAARTEAGATVLTESRRHHE